MNEDTTTDVLPWPEGLTPKARQLLERSFTVGRVRAEDCEPGDEPFIGCVAADYEGQGDSAWLTTSAKDIINELAEMDRLVGVRQPLRCYRHGDQVIFSMRLMVRPDTAGAVLAKIAEQGGSSPYMNENTRAHTSGPARRQDVAREIEEMNDQLHAVRAAAPLVVLRLGITGLPDGVIHEIRGEIGKRYEVATKCRPHHVHTMAGFWNGPRPDLPEGMASASLCGECFPGWALHAGKAYPPLIAKRTVVSPPGAAIEVTQLELTPEAQRALQVPAGAFGPEQRRAAKPDLKPMAWWCMGLAWTAFNIYVFTGWGWSFALLNWTVGGGLEPMPPDLPWPREGERCATCKAPVRYGPNTRERIEGDYEYRCTNDACQNAAGAGGYSGDPPPTWCEPSPASSGA
jgi:hypothetical protein